MCVNFKKKKNNSKFHISTPFCEEIRYFLKKYTPGKTCTQLLVAINFKSVSKANFKTRSCKKMFVVTCAQESYLPT